MITKKSKNIILSIVIIIAVISFLFIITMQYNVSGSPMGGDSSVYIMDAYSKMETGDYFTRYHSDYLQRSLYESPIHSLILIVVNKITGLDIEYPLFTVYQYLLVILIFVFTYVLTRYLFDDKIAVLAMISSLSFTGFYFLFYSSTVANFLGILIVLIMLIGMLKLTTKQLFILIPVGILLLFFTHKSLTFIFSLFTAMCLFFWYIPTIWNNFKKLRPKLRSTIILVLVIIIFIVFAFFLLPLLDNVNRLNYSESGNFRAEITFSTYVAIVGGIMSLFFIVSPFIFKKNIFSKRKRIVFSAIYFWVLLGIIFSLLPYIGIYFYSSRMLYMIWPFIYIISSYAFLTLLKPLLKTQRVLILIIFIVLVSRTTIVTNKDIATRTIFIDESQVKALQYLKNQSSYGDTILTNYNNIHPFNIAISTRVFSRVDYSYFSDVLNGDYLSEYDFSYIYITTGDTNGYTIKHYSNLIIGRDNIEQIYSDDKNILYKIKGN
ncbi:MAG: hypothetical protein ACNFW9_01725 [Candidatus Kerfeldbacteria bacterium]